MEFAVRTRQLARVFVDAQSLAITADQLPKLIEAARLTDRLSTPFVLPLPLPDPNLPAGSATRFALASASFDWQIALLSQSFDLTRLPTNLTGSNIGDLGEFAATAAAVLWELTQFFGRVPHRLVLVQSGMLGEMPTKKMDTIARQLLRLPPSVEAAPPFEWDWRCASHGAFVLGDRNEETNVVTTINRRVGSIQSATDQTLFDRIHIELDINTSPSDTRGRFEKQDLEQFFTAAVDEHTRLAAELTTFALEVPS
jgi:hypothetical protein